MFMPIFLQFFDLTFMKWATLDCGTGIDNVKNYQLSIANHTTAS